ncbi:MAG TPA: PDZ domain-containing protein [Marmoricola sp.]|nr:PDZ domain-containing protein [Marmoricola sp.]
MSRRSVASILAVVLLFGLAFVAARTPTHYVVFSPGPTINVLGDFDGKPILRVQGHRVYRDKGALRMVTVSPTGPDDNVNLVAVIRAWLDPARAVYPHDAVYQPSDTQKSVQQQSSQEMVSSQDAAIANALRALHIPFGNAVRVAGVDKGGPSAGKLKDGDQILAVDGQRVHTTTQVIDAISPRRPGTLVHVQVRRGNHDKTVSITTTHSTQDKGKSAIRVLVAPSYAFPFDVGIHISPNIGGPSAGLMFSLSIYDILTPGSLTHGKVVAGTGEISPQGVVGEIGGIQQKIVGAQDDGARLFLVPAKNCAEALGAPYDPERIRLVKVTRFRDALADVKAWAANPDAKLPRCTK